MEGILKVKVGAEARVNSNNDALVGLKGTTVHMRMIQIWMVQIVTIKI